MLAPPTLSSPDALLPLGPSRNSFRAFRSSNAHLRPPLLLTGPPGASQSESSRLRPASAPRTPGARPPNTGYSLGLSPSGDAHHLQSRPRAPNPDSGSVLRCSAHFLPRPPAGSGPTIRFTQLSEPRPAIHPTHHPGNAHLGGGDAWSTHIPDADAGAAPRTPGARGRALGSPAVRTQDLPEGPALRLRETSGAGVIFSNLTSTVGLLAARSPA